MTPTGCDIVTVSLDITGPTQAGGGAEKKGLLVWIQKLVAAEREGNRYRVRVGLRCSLANLHPKQDEQW